MATPHTGGARAQGDQSSGLQKLTAQMRATKDHHALDHPESGTGERERGGDDKIARLRMHALEADANPPSVVTKPILHSTKQRAADGETVSRGSVYFRNASQAPNYAR